jgi:hypothetical protein
MKDNLILVRFRFDGDTESQIGKFTYEQYDNLKSLPITKECEIVVNEKPTLSKKDMKLINKKIIDACKADKKSHTSKLSK